MPRRRRVRPSPVLGAVLRTDPEIQEYLAAAAAADQVEPTRAKALRDFVVALINIRGGLAAIEAVQERQEWARPGGRPRTTLTERSLATAWGQEYDPKLGRSRLEDVAERLGFEDSGWFRELYQRLHPNLAWSDYRPEFYPGFVTVKRRAGGGE